MQTAAAAFEGYVLGLLAILEGIPVPIGISFDRACERVRGNRAFRRLFGLSITENASLTVGPHRTRFFAAGAEIEPASTPLRCAARDGIETVDNAYQILRGDGARFDVVASAWPLRDHDGAIAGSIGVFIDVTQSKEAELRAQHAVAALAESERRYRLITEAMPEFVWLDAPDGSALYSNKRWLEYTGLTEEQNEGFGWVRVLHPEDAARLEAERTRTLQTGEPYEGECRYRGKDGKYRWFLFRSIAVRDDDGSVTCWLGTATDIDKQKRAEAQQAFFALASDILSSTLDVNTTLERIARLAVASLGTWCQIDVPDSRGHLRVTVVAHQDPEKEAVLLGLIDQHPYNPDARVGPPAVLRSVKPQLLQNVDEEAVEHVVPQAQHREIYRRAGYAAGLMVPLMSRGRVLGVLGIASDDPTRLYTEFDIATASELGRRGAAALENAHTFAREHRLASTLQRALLPATLPRTRRVEFWPAYAAAPSVHGEAVGGDWYDAFELEGGRIAVSVGDVAGHGIDAAVTMSVVRQAIRAAALEGHGPAEVLARANRMVALENRHTMVTAVFGIYDGTARDFRFACAGHPRPVAVQPDGGVRILDASGPPLGDAFDPQFVTEERIAMPAQTWLVFFTDGLLEFKRDLEAAEARLLDLLAAGEVLRAENPAHAIIDAMLDGPQQDDIAVLVMRNHP